MTQSGTENESIINQEDGSTTATVAQTGLRGVSTINQISIRDDDGSRTWDGVYANTAIVNTSGTDTVSTITQNSYSGYANVQQSGTATTSTIWQTARNANATVSQIGGSNNASNIEQSGLNIGDSGLTATVTQIGGIGNQSTIIQTAGTVSAGLTATVIQDGGSGLRAFITQEGMDNVADITQFGNDNTANVYQLATNNASTTILQSGTGNTVTVNQ